MDPSNDRDRERNGKGILHPEGMRAARQLAAGVVHEVNNVLGVIIGNAHLAKKNLSNASEVERYLGEVRGAAEEAREIMRQLSMLSGRDSSRTRLVSLNDLAHQASAAVATPVELELAASDPAVRLDLWLGQDALASVMSFMSSTGSVTSIRIVTRTLGHAGMMTLEDDGPTPGTDDLAALFSPFAKLHHRPKVGLGLTKLAHLAEQGGGHVTATGREPRGLRVVLTLPLASDAESSAHGPSVPLAE